MYACSCLLKGMAATYIFFLRRNLHALWVYGLWMEVQFCLCGAPAWLPAK